MKTFSQRKGLKPTEVIQVRSMNDALRSSIWNVLDGFIWSIENFLYSQYGTPEIRSFSRALWFHFFKEPVDSRPDDSGSILSEIRMRFFSYSWNEVYDFMEFVVDHYARSKPDLILAFNMVLEREMSGYRIVSGQVVDITGEQEIAMLDEALRDTRFAGTASHLQRALELFSDRDHPDYRNSIKESISAVESMA